MRKIVLIIYQSFITFNVNDALESRNAKSNMNAFLINFIYLYIFHISVTIILIVSLPLNNSRGRVFSLNSTFVAYKSTDSHFTLLFPLSQFGLFRQPQTSFTRSRNRESFTTLRRASLRRSLTHLAENHAYELFRKNRIAA